MNVMAIAALSVLALLALGGAAFLLIMGDRAFAVRVSAMERGVQARPSGLPLELHRVVRRLAERVSKGAVTDTERGALRLKLLQAGFVSERRVEYFFGARVLSAAVSGIVGLFAVLASKPEGLLTPLFLVFAAATCGLYLPLAWLRTRIKARVEQVRLAMPDALDLMVVCVEAGATLSAAMQKVEQELWPLHPVLAGQFRLTSLEIHAGAARSVALRRLGERAPAEELQSLVNLLIQSEALGASMGQTLRVFAEEMRASRFLRAEQKAAELPVKIAFPLVLFIFPCLMGVIFTPVIIRIIRVFMTVHFASAAGG